MNKLKIKLSDGNEIVVEINNHDGNHKEVCIYLEGPEIVQDICLVRENDEDNNIIECLVWTDENDEDYTHKFDIKKYKEEN